MPRNVKQQLRTFYQTYDAPKLWQWHCPSVLPNCCLVSLCSPIFVCFSPRKPLRPEVKTEIFRTKTVTNSNEQWQTVTKLTNNPICAFAFKYWPTGHGRHQEFSQGGHDFQLKTTFFAFCAKKRKSRYVCKFSVLKTKLEVFITSRDKKSSIFCAPTAKIENFSDLD